MFDADNFMNAVFTEANDTRLVPCPAGEFHAVIEKAEPKSGTIGKGDRIGQPWAQIAVSLKIEDAAVSAGEIHCRGAQCRAAHGEDRRKYQRI